MILPSNAVEPRAEGNHSEASPCSGPPTEALMGVRWFNRLLAALVLVCLGLTGLVWWQLLK